MMAGMTLDEARDLCVVLFLETLSSLSIAPRLRNAIRRSGNSLEIEGDSYAVPQSRDIRVVAVGKAAIEMAEAAAEALAGARFRGIVVAPGSAALLRAEYEYFQGGHPSPNAGSWRAAEGVLQFLENGSPDDLILFLLSGGGSALLDKPLHPSVSLEDLRQFHQALVTCGANIQEINTLRKHFSAVKGGRLAERAAPATQVTLYVSDVPEHLPSAVASGPTMPDETTLEDCRRIVHRYALADKFPISIRALLESGELPETPKPGDPCFSKSRYYGLLSNQDAVGKLVELAQARGFFAEADTSCDEWEFRRAGEYLLARLDSLCREHPGPVALVSGGELSCPVTGDGIGGRNQAFVLDCVERIAGKPVVVLSAGTDGQDGNSPACGAIADGTSAERAAALGLNPEEFLRRSDSYHFFDALGDTVVTGPTGTNVRDVRILLAYF